VNATQQSITTDLNVSIESVIALSLANCESAPDLTSASLTLQITPSPGGTFKSNCQNLSVTTNAPGYSLTARAENSEGSNSLLYLNPTEVTPLPEIPATSSPMSSPTTLGTDRWGFAVTSANVDLSDSPAQYFSPSYSVNTATNTYANLPATDTTIYTTDELPGQTDELTFYYGTNATSHLMAGMYSAEITYTAISADIPDPLPPPMCGTGDYECILYTVDMQYASQPFLHMIDLTTDGGGNISTRSYNWDIYVDDQPADILSCGGGNNCAGVGLGSPIDIWIYDGGIHQIKILPHNGPEPGWANAYNRFYNYTGSGEIISFDAPLTTMAFAPKPSESTTDASYMFASVCFDCTNLTKPIQVIDTYKLPDTVTDLSNFMSYIHYGNTSLTDPVDLSLLAGWLNGNESITDLSYFLFDAYVDSSNLVNTIDLSPISGWFNGNETITNLGCFLCDIHFGNSQLTDPIDLSPVAGWFSGNESITSLWGFLSGIHSGNFQLVDPIDLSPVAGWFNGNESILWLGGFLASVHRDNTQLTSPIDATPLTDWFNDGRLFWPDGGLFEVFRRTHYNNPNLILNGQVIFPNWVKTMNEPYHSGGIEDIPGTFEGTFYLPISQGGDTGEPKFEDGTVLSSIGEPRNARQTYTGRTGITPLNNGNGYWK